MPISETEGAETGYSSVKSPSTATTQANQMAGHGGHASDAVSEYMRLRWQSASTAGENRQRRMRPTEAHTAGAMQMVSGTASRQRGKEKKATKQARDRESGVRVMGRDGPIARRHRSQRIDSSSRPPPTSRPPRWTSRLTEIHGGETRFVDRETLYGSGKTAKYPISRSIHNCRRSPAELGKRAARSKTWREFWAPNINRLGRVERYNGHLAIGIIDRHSPP